MLDNSDTANPTDRIKDVAGFIDIRDILSSFLQGLSCEIVLLLYNDFSGISPKTNQVFTVNPCLQPVLNSPHPSYLCCILPIFAEVGIDELKEAKMLKRMRILEEAGSRFAGKCIKDLKSLGEAFQEAVHRGAIVSKQGAGCRH